MTAFMDSSSLNRSSNISTTYISDIAYIGSILLNSVTYKQNKTEIKGDSK